MSAVIKFPLEKVQRTSNPRLRHIESAKILIFEGVQYVTNENCEKVLVSERHTTPVRGANN
ncbi:MAG: hypothetical protein AAGA53_01475 [Pseudomonadota bacterium]